MKIDTGNCDWARCQIVKGMVRDFPEFTFYITRTNGEEFDLTNIIVAEGADSSEDAITGEQVDEACNIIAGSVTIKLDDIELIEL